MTFSNFFPSKTKLMYSHTQKIRFKNQISDFFYLLEEKVVCQVVQYHRVARVDSIGSGKKLHTIFDRISLKENSVRVE